VLNVGVGDISEVRKGGGEGEAALGVFPGEGQGRDFGFSEVIGEGFVAGTEGRGVIRVNQGGIYSDDSEIAASV